MLIVFVLLAVAVPNAHSAKILGLFVFPSLSHFIIQEPLMRELAVRGHEVTIVSHFDGPKEPLANMRYLQFNLADDIRDKWNQTMSSLFEVARQRAYNWIIPAKFAQLSHIMAESMRSPVVRQLRRDAQFDLVVFGWFMNDYQIGLATHFGCPAVIVSATSSCKTLHDMVGNPRGSSYTPMPYTLALNGQPTFFDRVRNTLMLWLEDLVVECTQYVHLEPMYRELFPPNKYPSYTEAKRNVALVLVTSHFSQTDPMVTFPAMVEVGGMHIPKQPGKLPEDIQHWLDTAENGVVYFCMGSILQSTNISRDLLTAIVRILGGLKQRVLFKWESDEPLAEQPANMMVQKWMPQSDVLAHSNVCLFITHSGKSSLVEARHHGVPVLGIPVFFDHHYNLDMAVGQGWAVPLPYADLTASTFAAALNESLANPVYGQRVRRDAARFADRPMHPLDTAVFWVEYVLRHRGAKHMQSQAMLLNWWQYYSLDVYALLAAVCWVWWKIAFLAMRCVSRRVFHQRIKVKTN